MTAMITSSGDLNLASSAAKWVFRLAALPRSRYITPHAHICATNWMQVLPVLNLYVAGLLTEPVALCNVM